MHAVKFRVCAVWFNHKRLMGDVVFIIVKQLSAAYQSHCCLQKGRPAHQSAQGSYSRFTHRQSHLLHASLPGFVHCHHSHCMQLHP